MVLGLYCAGKLGRELYDIATRINEDEKRWDEILFIDEVYNGEFFYGARVVRPERLGNNAIQVVIANGTPSERKCIREKVEGFGFELTNLIDPTAIISPTAVLGSGIIITPYSSISSNAVIHNNALIQSYVRVGHDIEVGCDSVISANVGIGGRTRIGDRTYIGLGAVIQDELSIGDDSIIALGSVVHTNVDQGVIVAGNPARVSRRNIDGIVFR